MYLKKKRKKKVKDKFINIKDNMLYFKFHVEPSQGRVTAKVFLPSSYLHFICFHHTIQVVDSSSTGTNSFFK